jgi:hypothetical protein
MNYHITIQFWHTDTGGVRKWGKERQNGGIGCEAGTCFMAVDVSEKYKS